VVATPIGNLEDMTFRAVRVLRQEVDFIACEDTRVTRRLLTHYGIDVQLLRHEAHNEARSTQGILKLLEEGQRGALLSDAGTPCISDPGYLLVNAAVRADIPVIPLPGACALTTALSASGLPTTGVTFHGFVPKRKAERIAVFARLGNGTHVFFLPARDLPKVVRDLADRLADVRVVVARELSKVYESWQRASALELLKQMDDRPTPKGEAVMMLHIDAPIHEATDAEIMEALAPFLASGMRKKEAVVTVAMQLGVKKRRVYQLSLKR
jgi:16S rRNA (cytidine1402-2'-O)-methyltransferase